MKEIEISYLDEIFKIKLSYIEAWPHGFYILHFDDVRLIKKFSSPVYIVKKEGSLSLPEFRNIDEASFLMSLAIGIFNSY